MKLEVSINCPHCSKPVKVTVNSPIPLPIDLLGLEVYPKPKIKKVKLKIGKRTLEIK